MEIGFIGTGVMGTGMINNLLKADVNVNVYNRTKSHADTVVKNGAHWVDTPKEIARISDTIITIIGTPSDVKEVYFGEDGIFSGIKKDTLLIDMTTSSPDLAQQIYDESKKRSANSLDAPVSGGDVGAKNGTLTIMVGGDKDAFEQAMPIFNTLGSSIKLFGGPGKGQYAKMANQIMIAGTMTGMIESLVYAKKAGLDLSAVVNTIDGGAAENWSMANYGPRILQGDFQPGFAAKHFLKDLRIALNSAKKMNIDLPATRKAFELYKSLVEEYKLGDEGTQALIKEYQQN